MAPKFKTVLIVGAGNGLSASLAGKFGAEGLQVALAARNTDKLNGIPASASFSAFQCDASQPGSVARLFEEVEESLGAPDIVIYNPSARVSGSLTSLEPAEVERVIAVTAYGGFLVGQQAAKRMLEKGYGSILFTGASASVRGYPRSAPFAMGKFALRGLAQSMARELAPQGIHVAHFVIDGAIRTPGREDPLERPDSLLDPDAIADTYFHVASQPRSTWTWEVELRPWLESF